MQRNAHQAHRAAPRTRHAGFTLVELLVVIAIISLLVALMMPGLAEARKQAQFIRCMANLRALAQWGQIYAQEWDGVLPSNGNTSASTTYYHELSKYPWVYKTENYLITGSIIGLVPDPNNRNTNKKLTTLFCPQTFAGVTPNATTDLWYANSSYAPNANLGGAKRSSPFANIPYTAVKTSLLSPDVFWFTDCNVSPHWPSSWTSPNIGVDGWLMMAYVDPYKGYNSGNKTDPLPWQRRNAVSANHPEVNPPFETQHLKEMCNFAFGDGHGERVNYSDFYKMSDAAQKRFTGN